MALRLVAAHGNPGRVPVLSDSRNEKVEGGPDAIFDTSSLDQNSAYERERTGSRRTYGVWLVHHNKIMLRWGREQRRTRIEARTSKRPKTRQCVKPLPLHIRAQRRTTHVVDATILP